MQTPTKLVASESNQDDRKKRRFANNKLPFSVRIAAIYLIVSLVWIFSTDAIIWVGFPEVVRYWISTTKGTVFVVATAFLIYWLCRREIENINRANLLLRAVANGIPDAVYVKDPNGIYLLMNEAGAQYVGKSLDEIIGYDDTALFKLESTSQVIDGDKQVLATGETQTYEQEVSTGTIKRTFLTTKTPLRDEHGNVTGIIGISRDISERKQNLEELIAARKLAERNLAQLKAVVSSLKEGVVFADSQGNFIDWNPSAMKLAGAAAFEDVHEKLSIFESKFELAIPHGPTIPTHEWPVFRLIRGESIKNCELVLRQIEVGGERIISFNGSQVLDSEGKIELVVLTMDDVTDRRKADNELRASENRFRELADSIPQIVWTANPDGVITHVNSRAVEYTGLSLEEFQRGAWSQCIHPDDFSDVIKNWKAFIQPGVSRPVEFRIRRTSGEYRWHLSRLSTFRDSSGRIVGWNGTGTDIEDLKRTEEELRRSTAMLRLVIDNIPQGVFWKDTNSRYLGCNKLVAQVMGLESPGDIIGMDTNDDPSITSEETAFFIQKDREVIESGVGQYHIFETMTLKNGTTIWLDTSKVPIHDTNGRVIGVLGTWQDVTDRKQREERLRTAEETLRMFVEHTPALIAMFDREMQYLHASRRWYTDYHLDGREIIGEKHYKLFPNLPQRWKDAYSRSLAGEIQRDTDDRFVFDDGTVQWIRWESRPWFQADGEVGGIIIFKENITDLKESLRQQRKLTQIIENSQDFIATASFDEKITYMNPAARRMIGLSPDSDLSELHFAKYIPEHLHDFFRNTVIPMTREKGRWEGESQLKNMKTGELLDVARTAFQLHDPETNESWFATVVRNITDQKRTEMQLRAAQDRMTKTMETAPIVLCSYATTNDGRRIMPFASPQIYDIYGLTPEELAQDFTPVFERYVSEDRDRVLESIERATETMTAWRDEFRVNHPNRGTIWVEGHSVPIRQEDGTLIWHGYIADITEKKRIEDQFQQSQKMESVGRLAGGIAHDFNNLLTVINGYANLILTESSPENPQRESVIAIIEAGERAANLTKQLLAFSRKTIVEPKIVDLNEIVDKSVNMLRRLIEEDIHLTVLHCPTVAKINIAPSQLEQILMNLVVNARDAMPEGGRLTIAIRKITLRSEEALEIQNLSEGEYAQLAVTDTGHGMSTEVAAKIFEPFFTTKPVGKGTGLGLSVVHGIVAQSDGGIAAESEVNVGTTFRILFPIAKEITKQQEPTTAKPPVRGNETVLLVEDEKAVRKIARISLEANGYTVLEAQGGTEALRLSDEYPGTIHLLLTDVVMPEIGGVKLVELIKQRRPEIAVLYMSGYTEDAMFHRRVENADQTLLQKPFTAVALARKVRAVLDKV